MHNANIAEDAPSSVARNDTTLDTRNATNANALPNGINEASRRHNNYRNDVHTASLSNVGCCDYWVAAKHSGHYLDIC